MPMAGVELRRPSVMRACSVGERRSKVVGVGEMPEREVEWVCALGRGLGLVSFRGSSVGLSSGAVVEVREKREKAREARRWSECERDSVGSGFGGTGGGVSSVGERLERMDPKRWRREEVRLRMAGGGPESLVGRVLERGMGVAEGGGAMIRYELSGSSVTRGPVMGGDSFAARICSCVPVSR